MVQDHLTAALADSTAVEGSVDFMLRGQLARYEPRAFLDDLLPMSWRQAEPVRWSLADE